MAGVEAMAAVFMQRPQAKETLMRATRTRDDDFRWTSSLGKDAWIDVVLLFKELEPWAQFLDPDEVRKMQRCASECSYKLASTLELERAAARNG